MSTGQWIVDLNVGLTGAFLVLKYIEIISENKNGGSIVLISSDQVLLHQINGL